MAHDLLTGFAAFVSTNIDDFLVLMFLFGAGVNLRSVVWGQFIGFAAILLVSLAGAFFAATMPRHWVGLFGLVPVSVGLMALIRSDRSSVLAEFRALQIAANLRLPLIFGVALLTLSNGFDNVALYAPLFATMSAVRIVATIAMFFVLLGLLCTLAYRLSTHPATGTRVAQQARRLMPFVIIGLGILILWRGWH